MKQLNSFTVIVSAICFWAICASPAQAETGYNTKVLLHGTKQVAGSSNWRLAGWSVLPNIGQGPVLMVGGIGYSVEQKWGVEVMVGTFSIKQEGQLLADVRASYDAFDPVHIWSNVEYFLKTGDWYTYLEANYRLGQICLIGMETENMHFPDTADDLSVGPRVVLPLSQGRFVLIGAYQFHSGSDQIWARAVLNF